MLLDFIIGVLVLVSLKKSFGCIVADFYSFLRICLFLFNDFNIEDIGQKNNIFGICKNATQTQIA